MSKTKTVVQCPRCKGDGKTNEVCSHDFRVNSTYLPTMEVDCWFCNGKGKVFEIRTVRHEVVEDE